MSSRFCSTGDCKGTKTDEHLTLGVIWEPASGNVFVRISGEPCYLKQMDHMKLHWGPGPVPTHSQIIPMRYQNGENFTIDFQHGGIATCFHGISVGPTIVPLEKFISLHNAKGDCLPIEVDSMSMYDCKKDEIVYFPGMGKLTNYLVRAQTHIVRPSFFNDCLREKAMSATTNEPIPANALTLAEISALQET